MKLPWMLVSAIILRSVTPASAHAQAATVAVLPLENGGSYGKDKDEYDGLRRGLAGLLGSELGRGTITVVARDRTQRMVDEQGAAVADRIDAQTAARIGKAAGARYVIVGTFIDLYGDFRLDARIIDASSGEILKVVRSDPKLSDRKQIYRIVQSVAQRIGEGINAGTVATGARNLPVDAVAWYGKGLLYLDRGDRKKAREAFEQAVKSAPGFAEAEEGLKAAGAA